MPRESAPNVAAESEQSLESHDLSDLPEGLAESLQKLYYRIEEEGFDYALAHYSDWKNIKDKNFHDKLAAYRKARRELLQVLVLDSHL